MIAPPILYVKDIGAHHPRYLAVTELHEHSVILTDVERPDQPPYCISYANLFREERFVGVASTCEVAYVTRRPSPLNT